MSSLTVTLIQSDLHWENPTANMQMLEKKISSIKEKTQVIILPEMFTTGFSMNPETFAETENGAAMAWMKQMAASKQTVVTGSVMYREKGNFYNRLVWMLPNGSMGVYDKRHLFAYADENNHYTAGKKRLIASVNGWRLNLLVCYDLRFPVWSRQSNKGEKDGLEYDVLVYIANWPQRRSHAWRTLLQARAIENQCYCIGLNRTGTDANGIYYSGDSMVVNPMGDILYHKADEEDIFTIKLQKEDLETLRRKMPFWQDADPFILLNE